MAHTLEGPSPAPMVQRQRLGARKSAGTPIANQSDRMPGFVRRPGAPIASLLVLTCACSGPSPEPEGAVDAGDAGESPPSADASGAPIDASRGIDATPHADAGTGLDAGAGSDAAPDLDGTNSGAPLGPGACPALTGGWARYYPKTTIQFQGAGSNDEYCTYSNDGGVEYFRLDKNPANLIQRCEARVYNDYPSGKNEFEGDVLVTEADNMCIHQVFNFLMIVGYPQNGGEFHQHSVTKLQSGVFGRWVHVNTLHDTATHTVQIYLDCAHVFDGTDSAAPSDAGWYDKYGLYGIQGLPPQVPTSIVQWTNVAYYRQP
jgi:hypothetical protein